MAKMTPEKRKKMEEAIYKFFKNIDDSRMNETFYREKFSSMSDAEFERYFRGFFQDKKAYLQIHTVDYKAPITFNEIKNYVHFLL